MTNTDMSETRWKQVGNQIQLFWGRIDDADLEKIAGKAERLAAMLQHKYGYTKQHAESQSIRWMRKHRDDEQPSES